jgi:Holliday junction resolvasome RuvABC endonuclease subunit
MIKSIDLGTTSGFAWYCASNNAYNHTHINFAKAPNLLPNAIKSDKQKLKNKAIRCVAFETFLSVFLQDAEIVCYEKVRNHKGVDASHAYGGFEWELMKQCLKLGIKLIECEVSSIKKHITGKGNANKEMMIKAVNERGFKTTQDDEADAIAILLYYLETQK